MYPAVSGIDRVRRHHQEVRQAPASEFLKGFASCWGEHGFIDQGDIHGVAGEEGKGGREGGELADNLHIFLAVDDDAPAEAFELRSDDEDDVDWLGRGGRRESAGSLRGWLQRPMT